MDDGPPDTTHAVGAFRKGIDRIDKNELLILGLRFDFQALVYSIAHILGGASLLGMSNRNLVRRSILGIWFITGYLPSLHDGLWPYVSPSLETEPVWL